MVDLKIRVILLAAALTASGCSTYNIQENKTTAIIPLVVRTAEAVPKVAALSADEASCPGGKISAIKVSKTSESGSDAERNGTVKRKKAVQVNLDFYSQSRTALTNSSASVSFADKSQDLSISDFRVLSDALKDRKGAGKRAEYYELAYFTGKFVNRFGLSIGVEK